ncbi:MAG: nucleotidyltransferase family protein [Acidobacteria bacterium]|nr:nucleotidyltransferase family protein [Acidobacteriota bacterium]
MKIAAVILAAGEGRRIGGPKALLPLDDATFLSRCAALVARPGVDLVIAVLGHEAARVAVEAGAPAGVRLVANARYGDGMLSSVLRGLDAAEEAGADAVLIHPVDHPLVSPETVDRVVSALTAGAVIAVPTHGGRRGHPGGFARVAWPALRAAPPDRGARAVLADHPDWIVHVTGDAGCVAGIDTPEDYERVRGSRRRPAR